MDQNTLISLGLVVAFVLVGGVFAGTELALVSLRESQINKLEQQSARGAHVARVARDPNRFLAAVQIGVTVAGFLSAAYGATTLAPDFAPILTGVGLPDEVADDIALILLTLVIAYLSLVFGELVPKRFALQRSTSIALVVGPPLDRFARLMRPVVWLLSISTNAVVRLLGGDPRAVSEEISGEELRYLVDQNEGLEDDERRILSDVFDAGERSLAEAMRPRIDVVGLDLDSTVGEVLATVVAQPYSRYPVIGDSFDDIRGFVHVRDFLGREPDTALADVLRPVLHLPSSNKVLPSLTHMQAEGIHLAIVVDEYGQTDGIVTFEDLVEELVGDIHDEYDVPQAHDDPRDDEADAGLTIEEFGERTGVVLEDGTYETAAGYVIDRLGRLAVVGDTVEIPHAVPAGGDEATAEPERVTLEVTAVERHRILRIAVRRERLPSPEGAGADTAQDEQQPAL